MVDTLLDNPRLLLHAGYRRTTSRPPVAALSVAVRLVAVPAVAVQSIVAKSAAAPLVAAQSVATPYVAVQPIAAKLVSAQSVAAHLAPASIYRRGPSTTGSDGSHVALRCFLAPPRS